MGMAVVVKREEIPFTYRDYASWPDDERWELVDGAAYDMCAAPSRRHQGISVVMSMYFSTFFKGKPCKFYYAPFDVVLPEPDTADWRDSVNVVQPDLLVVCDPSKLTNQGCVGAPDLTVEIISPYTSKKDIREKFDLYERKGVREYWIVFPGERAVHVFRRTEEGRFDEGQIYDLAGPRPSSEAVSSLFPGLSVPLKELFQE